MQKKKVLNCQSCHCLIEFTIFPTLMCVACLWLCQKPNSLEEKKTAMQGEYTRFGFYCKGRRRREAQSWKVDFLQFDGFVVNNTPLFFASSIGGLRLCIASVLEEGKHFVHWFCTNHPCYINSVYQTGEFTTLAESSENK